MRSVSVISLLFHFLCLLYIGIIIIRGPGGGFYDISVFFGLL